MNRFRVKLCGLTRPSERSALAARLGVDLAGMIFFRKSKRFVTQKVAREISGALPSTVMRVGVFVDEDISKVLRAAERLRLDYVQLHGSEPASYIARLQREGYRIIKAFSISSPDDYAAVYRSRADLRLLDHRTPKLVGGTGQAFDWRLKPKRRIPNLVLAGGLTADNVSEGVRLFAPHVIDVNSGVETRPGIKSRQRLAAFMNECDRIRYDR